MICHEFLEVKVNVQLCVCVCVGKGEGGRGRAIIRWAVTILSLLPSSSFSLVAGMLPILILVVVGLPKSLSFSPSCSSRFALLLLFFGCG